MTFWSADEVSVLVNARAAKASMSMAAALIGKSRSAIAGALYRSRNPAGERTPRPKREKIARRPSLVEAPLAEVVAEPRPQDAVTIEGLGFGKCRYPMWDRYPGVYDAFYCGSATPRDGAAVYCAAHAARMFVPAQPRRKK